MCRKPAPHPWDQVCTPACFTPQSRRPTPVEYAGSWRLSVIPYILEAMPTLTGSCSISRPSASMPERLAPPPVSTRPAGTNASYSARGSSRRISRMISSTRARIMSHRSWKEIPCPSSDSELEVSDLLSYTGIALPYLFFISSATSNGSPRPIDTSLVT